ncbi:MAG: hypothetical protein RBS43_01525 [Candidatus Cloacimonas sp.]|jgi:hypothetical protein|nr:hypothetical protein [Candidatus Cloacimonas sp.]
MNKVKLLVLLLVLCGLMSAAAKPRYKALAFDNPGTRRILKNDQGSYFFFRSLPEKAMKLNTTGITSLEIRSFSTDAQSKPEIITIIGKSRQAHALQAIQKTTKGHNVYAPLTIQIPNGTTEMQVLCYSRSMYMRAFNILPPKTVKKVKLKNLVIMAHGGAMSLLHNGSNSDYYSLIPSQSFKFTLNNSRNAVVYVRPRLLDRSTPKLGVYHDGKLIQTLELNFKRTTKYHVQGINSLGVSKKIELPKNHGTMEIELRALSDHLFIAKPVLLKVNK